MFRVLLSAALCMIVLVFFFEVLDQALFPHIRLWLSNALTIIFSGITATIIAWFVLRTKQWARELVWKREMEFQIVFEQSALGMALLNLDGSILRSNRALQQMVGYSDKELCGKRFTEFTHPDDVTLGAKSFQELLEGQRDQYQAERRYVCRDGQAISAGVTVSVIRGATSQPQSVLAVLENITARKAMERQLAEALDFNWRIIAAIPTGIAVYKETGRCILANEAAAQMIGAIISQMLSQNFRKLESWRTSGLQSAAEKALNRAEPVQGEFHHISSFGKELWLVAHLSQFVRNNETHLLVTLTDITERKRAEKALQMFQFATDQAAEGVFWLNQDAGFRYVNDQACRLLGYTREELMHLHLFDIDPAYSKERWEKRWNQFLRKEMITRRLESLHRRKDGSTFPVEVTSKHLTMDGVDVHVAFVRDITEYRRAEEKIHEQAALLDVAPDAIWVLDSNKHISYWNKGAERIYGWSAAEAVGKSPVDLMFQGAITPQLQDCIKSIEQKGEWIGEMREFTKEGKPIVTESRSIVIRDERNQRKSLLIINTDITERKKLEAQLLRSQRMESLGTLAGGIAHDLNNVLTPIMFAIQLLKENNTNPDGRILLETLQTNVERGAKLIKQVLTFARGVQGERILIQPVHIVREIEQIIRETFPKSVQFRYDCPAGLWPVTGDPTQLHQVLLNLCVNARDAMPEGGKLSLRLKNVTLDEGYSPLNPEAKAGPYVVVEVTDTGTGIPREIQGRIFEPFFTTKKFGHGSGLGLSTTLGIVKSHGGFINCYSEPGQGSTFKVYLPANAMPPAAENAAIEQSNLPRGHNELVLLVDDEEPIRRVGQKTLESFGYRVLLASDGAQALSIYTSQGNDIAAVITDMAMPVMDGPSTIAALKAINPKVKIIGSSGLDSHYGAKVSGTGIGHFIPKPYSTKTMLLTLHELLHESSEITPRKDP